MRSLRLAALLGFVIASLLVAPAAAEDCRFVLGFKALHDAIPDRVGNCLDNEAYNPQNGDALQHTTAWHGKGGLLAWRKADNWTAFTDGASTWVNGPYGVQQRSNGQRFSWEGDALGYPRPASETTSSPSVPIVKPTALCRDGTLSYSAHRQGTCSWHGGVAQWY